MKSWITLFVLATSSVAMFAQQVSLEPRISLVAPMGDFRLPYEKAFLFRGASGAGTGFGLGADASYPIGLVKDLYVFGSLDLFFNGVSSKLKENVSQDNPEASIDYNRYTNIPVMAGVKYEYVVPDIYLRTYVKAGFGVNIFSISEITLSQPEVTQTFTFKPTAAGAATFGAGVILEDKYTIGFEFMSLGNHTPKGELEEVKNNNLKGFDITDTYDPQEMPVRVFRLTAGFKLF